MTTGNQLHKKHPLGSRARGGGGLVVRFEMPFAIWCTTCKPHETLIGQGVRFNAEKKKIGNYYSTPVYGFRMRHTACGGWIEIRTDPKNTAYVVTEGARKRETGVDDVGAGTEIAGVGVGEREKGDPFARLEGKVEDKRVFDTEKSRILELQNRQERDWEDPYEKSKRLRRRFRVERKGLQAAEAKGEALKDKMSLGIELVGETDEDRVRAEMVDFGAADGPARAARLRPMFESKSSGEKSRRRPKATDLLAQRKESFRNELAGNTRAAVDPFLNDENSWDTATKRRKTKSATPKDGVNTDGGPIEPAGLSTPDTTTDIPAKTSALVAYGSDSE